MKILLVSPYFFPAQYFGGAPQGLYKNGKELAKRGHEVVVFTSDAKDLDHRLNVSTNFIDGMKIFYFKNLTMILAKTSRLFITPELCRMLKLELSSFDVVYANEYTTFQNVLVHKYAKKYRVPYVVQARGSLPKIGRSGRKWVFDSFFGSRLLSDASAVVALTRTEANLYRKMGVNNQKIVIIPNGINLSEYASLPPKGCLRRRLGIAESERIILFLGRIHEIKGIDILVKAFAHAKRTLNLTDVSLVIAGSDDGYLDKLKSLLGTLNIADGVIFTGPLYGKDKLEAYRDADVFVLPSYYEAFPNVILEAYCCSKPVIASNVQSISDIVLDRKTGLLFKAASVESLSESILYIFSHKEEAEAMGRFGQKMVESKFSMEKVGNSFETLFKNLVRH